MAAPTRLYLGGTAAAINCGSAVNANGLAGVWEGRIGTITTAKAVLTADGTLAIASNVNVIGSGVNPNDWWFGSWLTDPLPNGKLLNGNFMGTILSRESSTSMNAFTQIAVYVVDNTGALLATLVAPQTTGGTEFNNPSANNRMWPRTYTTGTGPAISSYTTVNATSRILIETGVRIETTRTGDSAYQYMGNNGGSDLPTGDGSDNSTTKNPWFEFSIDLFAAPAGGGTARTQVMTFGYHEQQDPELERWHRRRSGLWVR